MCNYTPKECLIKKRLLRHLNNKTSAFLRILLVETTGVEKYSVTDDGVSLMGALVWVQFSRLPFTAALHCATPLPHPHPTPHYHSDVTRRSIQILSCLDKY